MPVRRAALGGAFGSGLMPPGPQGLDVASAIDAAVRGASSLLQGAYLRRVAEQQRESQRRREALEQQRWTMEREDRLASQRMQSEQHAATLRMQESRARADDARADALAAGQGIFRGRAPAGPELPGTGARMTGALETALSPGGLGASIPAIPDARDTERYEQLDGGYYVDRDRTPEAVAARRDAARAEQEAAARAAQERAAMGRLRIQEAGADRRAAGQRSTTLEAARIRATTGANPQAVQREQSIRKEYADQPVIKNATTLAEGYEKMRLALASPTAQSDMSLIFGYMKMQDPGSTVREGEYASARNTASWPEAMRNLYNRARAGRILDETQRRRFFEQATAMVRAQQGLVRTTQQRFGGVARRAGVDSAFVAFDPFDGVPLDDAGAARAAYLNDPEFRRFVEQQTAAPSRPAAPRLRVPAGARP